jgi:hypothetical protein
MRPRGMTIRRWMIVGAVVVCAFGLAGLSPKARRMRAEATLHAQEERKAIDFVADDKALAFRGQRHHLSKPHAGSTGRLAT